MHGAPTARDCSSRRDPQRTSSPRDVAEVGPPAGLRTETTGVVASLADRLRSLPPPALYPDAVLEQALNGRASSEWSALRGVLPFVGAACLALSTMLVPPIPAQAYGAETFFSVALVLLAGGIGFIVRYAHLGPWARALPAYLFFPVVALLRHADGGATSGFSILVLLALTALAIDCGRAQLFVGLVVMSATFVIPILALGPPAYPDTEWRRLVLWLIVGSIASHTMQELVTETRRQAASADREARTDVLTGLPNRRALHIVLDYEMTRARRSQQPLAVALLDLDHFKRYNDERGHGAGDALLRSMAGSWSSCVRTGDLLTRYGGEEFVLVLPGTSLETAGTIANRLRLTVPALQTCSGGVVVWDGAESRDTLFGRADRALYAAKRQGRNRVVLSAA